MVIGDLMIDHYIYGNCNRISPEAPIPVVEVTHETHTLGGAGNVLKNLNAFNCTADIISVTGDDKDADTVERLLTEDKMKAEGLVKDTSRCTTVKSRVLAVNHQLIRMDREVTNPIQLDIEQQIISRFKAVVNDYDIVLVSDYNKGLLTESLLNNIFAICRDAGVRTLVDPKGTDFNKYKGAGLIKPNKKEAGIAAGITINDQESLKLACRKIMEITDCDEIVVTLSEDGIALFTDDNLTIIPTHAMGVIDVTGAGDTVLASLGIMLASGSSLYDAAVFANKAAAIVVSKVGSATATVNEINDRFPNQPLF